MPVYRTELTLEVEAATREDYLDKVQLVMERIEELGVSVTEETPAAENPD